MLSAVQLREKNNVTLLTLPIGAPSPSNPFFIKHIEGLDPVKADVVTSSFANKDGAIYNHSRVGLRNIVMTVGFLRSSNPALSAPLLRDKLYGMFYPKSSSKLVFLDARGPGNEGVVTIDGYVESIESDIFSQNIEAQISIVCPDPYFSRYNSMIIDGLTGTNLDVSGFGTAPAGFILDITLTRDSSGLLIEAGIDEPLTYGQFIETGDRIRISTLSGNKFVTRQRNGVVMNNLDALTSGTMNMTVHARTPIFYVNHLTAEETPHPYQIFYTPKYVGV